MTDPKKLWERAWELVPKEDTGSGLWNALGALGLGKFAHTGKGKAKVLGFTPDGGLDFDFTEKLKELHLSISKQDLENETLEKVREAPTLERSDKSITSLNIAILVRYALWFLPVSDEVDADASLAHEFHCYRSKFLQGECWRLSHWEMGFAIDW